MALTRNKEEGEGQETFVEQAKAQLEKLNTEVKHLGVKLEEAQADGKAQLQQQLATLERQRDEAEQRLNEIGQANADAWDSMKSGFENAWSSLQQGMEDARKRHDRF